MASPWRQWSGLVLFSSSKSSQPFTRCSRFDPELPPPTQAAFESTVAQHGSSWREHNDGEGFWDRAFVDPGESRDRLRACMGVIKDPRRWRHPFVDGRLKASLRDRRLVWDRDVTRRTQPAPATGAVKKATSLLGMVGCNIALDGGADRRRDDKRPDRPRNHTTPCRWRDTALSARSVG